MSRSVKKYSSHGMCLGSNHDWARLEHRRFRRRVNQILHIWLDETFLPHQKEYHDPWKSPTDGKVVYFKPFWRYKYPEIIDKFRRK